jgi:hypothetical protein
MPRQRVMLIRRPPRKSIELAFADGRKNQDLIVVIAGAGLLLAAAIPSSATD